MNREEITQALDYLRQSWPYTPLPEVQLRHFSRLLAAWKLETFVAVIDDFIDRGLHRPGPAELSDLLRSRAGLPDPNAPYKQTPGPFIDDEVLSADLTPSEEYPARMAEIRASLQAHPSGHGESPEEVLP